MTTPEQTPTHDVIRQAIYKLDTLNTLLHITAPDDNVDISNGDMRNGLYYLFDSISKDLLQEVSRLQ